LPFSAQTIASADTQIKVALLAARTNRKEKAMVYGYSPKGDFIVLRKEKMKWFASQMTCAGRHQCILLSYEP